MKNIIYKLLQLSKQLLNDNLEAEAMTLQEIAQKLKDQEQKKFTGDKYQEILKNLYKD
jgi:hypothetical protein